MHGDEPLVSEPVYFEREIAAEKVKRYKSPGIYQVKIRDNFIYQIPAELIHEG
jgi:hypothetical protein